MSYTSSLGNGLQVGGLPVSYIYMYVELIITTDIKLITPYTIGTYGKYIYEMNHALRYF